MQVPEPVLELQAIFATLVSQRIVGVHVAPTRPTLKKKLCSLKINWIEKFSKKDSI